MQYVAAALNATGQLAATGSFLLQKIQVKQLAAAAPVLYLQVFNLVAPTIGVDLPVLAVPIDAGSTVRDGRYRTYIVADPKGGIPFGTAIFLAVTTTLTGSVAPTAGQEPDVVVQYNTAGGAQ